MKRHLVILALAAFTLRAEPPPAPGKTTLLFDGQTLAGWEGNAKLWRVEDGCLTGGSLTETVKHNDFLATTKDYGNFIVRLKIKLTGSEGFINSGFQIRSQRVPNNSEMAGYQCDFGEPSWYGAIYDESRRNKLMAESDMKALRPVIKKDDWNEYVIRAQGPRITTWINGVQGCDYTEADPAIVQTGKMGIQVHGGGKALVQVKDITIEELPAPKPGEIFIPAPPPKAAKAGPLSPEEERALFTLPPGFEIELVAQEDPANGIGKFVCLAFDQKGRLWTTTALEYPVDGNENPAAADALYASKAKDKVLVFDVAAAVAATPPSQTVPAAARPSSGPLLAPPPPRPSPPNPAARAPQKQSATGASLPLQPRVFADGLAIPLGVLPYKNGCYVQHGHDIAFLEDTDGDGRADKRTVILTGFGVQDSHLFPHQFLRAPGGWIWMAQGAFNYSQVRRPGEPPEKAVKFDQTRMAKFRPDGSGFDITSNGPCNIWGLVLDGEGQAWIQEANDFGYPVMPFHEYANYPGCSDSQWKSYAPEFPGTAPDFKMGGTGLSGLALSDKWEVNGDPSSVNGGSAPPITDHRSPITHTFPKGYCDVMFVANPITRKIQAIKIHPDGPRHRLQLLGDFIQSADEWFRPVAITFGPDGCLYIVDWYNKIISHNEVPRNHPDRDKTRGRIWRVKATGQKPFPMQDFTKATGDELLAKLGGPSLAQSHLAWQALVDRFADINPPIGEDVVKKVVDIASDDAQPSARRIQALWVLRESITGKGRIDGFVKLASNPNRNIRREFVRMDEAHRMLLIGSDKDLFASLKDDQDSDVRAEVIRAYGARLELDSRQLRRQQLHEVERNAYEQDRVSEVRAMLGFAREPLAEPLAPATRNGKPIKVREAYEREFERYLVRLFLEKQPEAVAKFLDSPDAQKLPVESRLLASLALEPKTSASRVAQLLPKLTRPPGQEEVLRLVQFLDEPGVGDAVKAALGNPAISASVLESLLAVRTKIEAAKLTPLLADAAQTLLAKPDAASLELGVKLAGAFKLANAEPALVAVLERIGWASRLPGSASRGTSANVDPPPNANPPADGPRETRGPAGGTPTLPAGILRALAEIGTTQPALFAKIAKESTDPLVRDESLAALASSKNGDAGKLVLDLWPGLSSTQRRAALDRLTSTKPGAKTVVAALKSGALAKTELDGPILEKLQTILPNDADLNALMNDLAALFRPVLTLNGKDDAHAETGLVIEGPFTVETWVRLAPGIGNGDGILFAKGTLDLNFYDSKFRVWVGGEVHDAIVATKPIAPDLWTHIAATRDTAGKWKIYLNGELDTAESKIAAGKFVNPLIGATGAPGGTKGALAEYRIWNRERTAEEIRDHFDRVVAATPAVAATPSSQEVAAAPPPQTVPATPRRADDLVFRASGETGWGKLGAGAKIAKTSDFPPILTTCEAVALDAKFSKYRALADQPGDAARGKVTAALCQACHLMGPTGGNIGPNLSGVGAMGTEAILRNILTPNAAMENGYRIYRVEMKNGDLLEAFFVSEDKDAVIVRLPGAADRRIAKSEIARTQYLRRSLMPDGLLDGLPPEQVSDLFAFLKTLK